ncbi:hypothetical protein NTE_00218 [Candidatus Nitrososphaera evergladensis SR1]|uniref:Plastocyanin n=1 Tax=Candidatus Nitrososphaera evergladensis SR1 TaxID=1459636 RepID=A0A075MME0_9ARCH|nr:hypothetical protein [Candidatus Nitrososphaera evergladensis]AIF82300.1 hypothetical protein NTE_00218 [Candidatus Nitrososphaera evergladensis SR1]
MTDRKFVLFSSLPIAILSSLVVIFAASLHLANAQSIPADSGIGVVDTSPNAAVIIIDTDASGNIVFKPNNVTIKIGEEILILNNSTSPQSFTSGKSSNDPTSGTMFDTGLIQPKQFTEYTAANLREGQYPFYSTAAPTTATGTLTIVAAKQ